MLHRLKLKLSFLAIFLALACTCLVGTIAFAAAETSKDTGSANCVACHMEVIALGTLDALTISTEKALALISPASAKTETPNYSVLAQMDAATASGISRRAPGLAEDGLIQFLSSSCAENHMTLASCPLKGGGPVVNTLRV